MADQSGEEQATVSSVVATGRRMKGSEMLTDEDSSAVVGSRRGGPHFSLRARGLADLPGHDLAAGAELVLSVRHHLLPFAQSLGHHGDVARRLLDFDGSRLHRLVGLHHVREVPSGPRCGTVDGTTSASLRTVTSRRASRTGSARAAAADWAASP